MVLIFSYKFIQLNSSTGYSKVEPFYIEINNNIPESIELKDYKIPVPNTSTNKKSILYIIYLILNIFKW